MLFMVLVISSFVIAWFAANRQNGLVVFTGAGGMAFYKWVALLVGCSVFALDEPATGALMYIGVAVYALFFSEVEDAT